MNDTTDTSNAQIAAWEDDREPSGRALDGQDAIAADHDDDPGPCPCTAADCPDRISAAGYVPPDRISAAGYVPDLPPPHFAGTVVPADMRADRKLGAELPHRRCLNKIVPADGNPGNPGGGGDPTAPHEAHLWDERRGCWHLRWFCSGNPPTMADTPEIYCGRGVDHNPHGDGNIVAQTWCPGSSDLAADMLAATARGGQLAELAATAPADVFGGVPHGPTYEGDHRALGELLGLLDDIADRCGTSTHKGAEWRPKVRTARDLIAHIAAELRSHALTLGNARNAVRAGLPLL